MNRDEIQETIKNAVHDIYRWRGTIVGGLAQFESTLIDACIQLNNLPQYANTLTIYPEKPSQAISYMEGLMATVGILSPHQADLMKLFREYEVLSVDRNLYAHGIMTLKHSGGEALSLEIALWHRKSKAEGKGTKRRKEEVLLSEVRQYADDVSDLADRAMGRFRLMYGLHGFGGLDDLTL